MTLNILVASNPFLSTQLAAATLSMNESNSPETFDNSPQSTSDTATLANNQDGQCPEGTTQASPPLNSQLRCIPTNETSKLNGEP